MHNLRFCLLCLFSMTARVNLETFPNVDCNSGSVNISLHGGSGEFVNLDCSSPLVVKLTLDGVADDSCEAVQNLKIYFREEWQGSEDRTPPEIITSPADYVVVNMVPHPYPVGGDFPHKIQNLQNEHNLNHGSFLYNFIITQDGKIYEALGWDKINFINNGGLNSLRIRLMMVRNPVAPPEVMQAIKSLVRLGKCRGSVSQNYKLIPYTHIRDYASTSSYKVEYDVLRNLENLDENKEFENFCGVSPPTPITYRDEWDAGINASKYMKYDSVIDVVVVRDFYSRCLNFKNCYSMMKYHKEKDKLGNINFFIAEDGQVYEYLGWEYTDTERLKNRKAIIVAFLGRYTNYNPSKRAFATFEDFLQYGLAWGYLSNSYVLTSYYQIKNNVHVLGASLNNKLKTLDRYIGSI